MLFKACVWAARHHAALRRLPPNSTHPQGFDEFMNLVLDEAEVIGCRGGCRFFSLAPAVGICHHPRVPSMPR